MNYFQIWTFYLLYTELKSDYKQKVIKIEITVDKCIFLVLSLFRNKNLPSMVALAHKFSILKNERGRI